ncbi:hypothetical protein QOZ80_5BG0452420 [Eleusine coracana subsp. coracana]|nr:hypothetical protein QOZ80_5BG0452420 [Eleusine coracana subsp. coracana]
MAAAAAAGYSDASSSTKKIRVAPLSHPLFAGRGGDAAAAAAATTEATAEEDNEGNGEHDGYVAVGEELVEDEDSLSAGEHSESDGEDEESQGDGEESESDGDEESMEEEEEEEESMEEDDDDGDEASPEPISPAPSLPHARAGGTVVEDVMVADADALECGVCFLPLKPPIFQCERGHVLCSPCRDKLKSTTKCHVCSVATRGYSRCYAMEHLVASIRIRCPHAAHGCNTRPAYHDRDSHGRVCPHAPCHCPGASCGFIGSTTTLLDHFATVHGWPCTTKVRLGETSSIRLHDGFNFLGADRADRNDQDAVSSIPSWLFLLNVTQERLGRAISVLCVHPHAMAALSTSHCELIFSHYGNSSNGAPCSKYYQSSEFQVAWTDLSNGLPNPDLCFQFVLPNSVLGDDKEGIQIKARIIIN